MCHIHSCKRFAAFLNRSPDTATTEDIRRFQLHLAETGVSICNRNRIMTGLWFLFRVTLRRLDLADEVYHCESAPNRDPTRYWSYHIDSIPISSVLVGSLSAPIGTPLFSVISGIL